MIFNNAADGLPKNKIKTNKKDKCKICLEANLKKSDIPKARTRTISRPLEVIGCDLQEIEAKSHAGFKYLAIYADHDSGLVVTKPLKKKSEQSKVGIEVINRLEKAAGLRAECVVLPNKKATRRHAGVDTVRADQGGEYTAKGFVDELRRRGIRLEYSDTDQPFQNGLAETMGGKIVSMMRAARVASGVPKMFWAENAAHHTWIHNRVSLHRQRGKTTPIEELTGKRADLSRAMPFGCEAWVVIRRQLKQKLDARAERAVHLGVSLNKKAWVLLLWDSRRIVESRNVYFCPNEYPFKDKKGQAEGTQERERRAEATLLQPSSDEAQDARQDDEDRQEQGGHGEDRGLEEQGQEDRFGVEDGDADEPDPHACQGGRRQDGEGPAAAGPVRRQGSRIRRAPARFADEDHDWRRIRTRFRAGKQARQPAETVDQADAPHMIYDHVNAEDGREAVEHANNDEVASGVQTETDGQDEDVLYQLDEEAMYALLTAERVGGDPDPLTEDEARKSPNCKEWLSAEDEEYKSLIDEDVFDLVDRPKNAPVLPSKMAYKTKRGETGEIERYKARFVVKGCCDPWKVFKETFAPTLRYATMRVIIALATLAGAEIHQLDVKTAFLNGVLPSPVYVEQPRSHVKGDPIKTVLRLKKALYGLVEAPRLWYETLTKAMVTDGFSRATGDPCLYFRWQGGHLTIVGVFVDDFLMFSTNDEQLQEAKQALAKKFKTKDMGLARWVLGMRIQQSRDAKVLDQAQYAKDISKKYEEEIRRAGVHKRAPNTPLPRGQTFTKNEGQASDAEISRFRSAMGSLAHLAIGTSPVLSHAVSALSRHLSNPSDEHWDGAMHVVRYVAENYETGVEYRRPKELTSFSKTSLKNLSKTASEPTAAVDSDYATDVETSRSLTGYIIMIAGGAVSWRSKMQATVATSSCHAEYVAASELARELMWCRFLLEEIGMDTTLPSIVYEDNMAAQLMTANVGVSDRSKHIRVRIHYVRECVAEGSIKFTRIESKNNPADALTKSSSLEAIEVMMKAAGMVELGPRPAQGG
jgi:hypothetical protein